MIFSVVVLIRGIYAAIDEVLSVKFCGYWGSSLRVF
jgi:hypothetical protein